MARLNTDGTLDTGFRPERGRFCQAIAVEADGRILAGGDFTSIGGQMRNRIAQLDATTGAADFFNPNANNTVHAIAVQADAQIVVGGDFIGEHRRSDAQPHRPAEPERLAGRDFNPDANNTVAYHCGAGGRQDFGGRPFTSIGGATRNRIALLEAGSGLADLFDPNANGAVNAIAVQADGKILAGGQFNGANSIGGQPRNRIARLDATAGAAIRSTRTPTVLSFRSRCRRTVTFLAGGLFTDEQHRRSRRATSSPGSIIIGAADLFDPNANANVSSIALQADGKVLAGGFFTTIGGQTRNLFARLSNDTAARQNLAVTQSTITWTRGGSSPQFTRVTFESSNDNVNYTPLGNGTPAGNYWTMTGLNLPTGLNFYIRARGYYRSGVNNGSESIAESVRNAFIAPLATHRCRFTQDARRRGNFRPGYSERQLRSGMSLNCGTHTLVFTFSNDIVNGNASVTSGTGSVSGSPAFATNTMTVNLTGVTDVQKITVTLSGVTGSLNQMLPDTAVSMNVLAGDTNGNKTVNATDIGQTKAQSGVAVTTANFRQDVTPNGSINASDIGLVKSRSGQSVP